ncbi:Protein of unknown function [Peptoniphilus asaccharolyticus DSM 20463]|uniref:DUF1576 domain-containing protein n=1 Tax=Peptoniphilus asaccharolyticus DSM 20463 TaxID=573058 RepID=A0A1W1V3K3_PEPAS|nr:DUF1576 domain-containing protein [Peptoniphilus asaccharolyticus]MBL7576220.1 DUF1576 domain-containing protein [Peptoniphilus asaccharolyticus]SMB87863.1 Protein of unknown function [Peptoniphilus asaccharolyticus DSM 20463]
MHFRDKKSAEIYKLLYFLAAILFFSSFVFDTPTEVLNGFVKILVTPSNLLTDYMLVGGIGAAFFNASTIMLVSILITKSLKDDINGSEVAAILLVTGFAFFGKNIYNSIPITVGVFLYAKLEGSDLKSVILPALFGTALGPLVSEITFSFGYPLLKGFILSYISGILIGLVITPVASACLRFHQGYNLYNSGFTAGIIGMIVVGILRMFDIEIETVNVVYIENDFRIRIILYLIFISMVLYGLFKNKFNLKSLFDIMKHSGRLPSDFIALNGLYPTIINMGVMGLISTTYVILIGGKFNGPVIGGILSVTAFGAFGKHPKNSIPILIGVYLTSTLNKYDISATSSILAGLFGTTLAPITGEFGFFSGIIAGFLHMALVFNIGAVHGGINLYNNGFSGGFVAAMLVPILKEFKKIMLNLRRQHD